MAEEMACEHAWVKVEAYPFAGEWRCAKCGAGYTSRYPGDDPRPCVVEGNDVVLTNGERVPIQHFIGGGKETGDA